MDITKIVDKYFRPFVASAAAIFLIPGFFTWNWCCPPTTRRITGAEHGSGST